jgi:hypothetical protein
VRLPRALRALANEAVVTEDGLTLRRAGTVAARSEPHRRLAGRATRVP